MEKLPRLMSYLLLNIAVIGGANASIVGVVTESTASSLIDRYDTENDFRYISYSGEQISESYGDASFGYAASFDTTSRVGPGVVEFQNGNASYGRGVQSVSRTVVDVYFENTGSESVRPTLNSQITPAGLGIYVSGCMANDLRNCALRDDGDYDWQDVGNRVAPGAEAVGTRFDFKVMAGDEVLFELNGGLSLVLGEDGSPNRIVQDFGGVENFLTDFRQTSPFGSEQQISFDWGATDFLVEFPEAMLLAPGEIGNITYITEVSTFSTADCYDTGRQACPIAYGSFGDPIGRGGAGGTRGTSSASSLLSSLLASPLENDSGSIEGLEFGLYEFNYPTFENGQIGFRAVSGPGINSASVVPAPASAGLLLLAALGLFACRRHN
ncbi:hypothetical protein [Alteromonas sp. H39]|uniref:hypothetical protein n=1 Tax=Alteromonas sp. H39 TaxID=3389876 RepID=UPI0039DFC460